MAYSIQKQTNLPFAEAIAKTKTALAEEGFGILTEIDVKETLRKKLNVEWDNYVILGTCNPPFALQALQSEKEIGLFLPCNVIVYQDKDKIFISAIRPTIAMGTIKNPILMDIAEKVEEKLATALSKIFD